eukprot:jgi/Ulvmu1/11877/UM081_0035.1
MAVRQPPDAGPALAVRDAARVFLDASVRFVDAVKHLQSHYGPSDKQYLADDLDFSSWDDSTDEDELAASDEAMHFREAVAGSPRVTAAEHCPGSPSAPPLPAEMLPTAGVPQPPRSLGQPSRPQVHVSPPYSGISGASADDMPLFSRAHAPGAHGAAAPAQYTSPATPSSRAAITTAVDAPTSPAGLSSSCSSLSLPSPSQRRYDSALNSSSDDNPQMVGMYGHHPASPSCPPVVHITSVLGPQRNTQPSAPTSATAFVERQRSAAGETPLHYKPARINLNASPACTASPDSPSPTKRLPGDPHGSSHDGAADVPLSGPPGGLSPTRRHFGRASAQPADAAARQTGRPRPLQTSQEHNRLDAPLRPVPEAGMGHAAPPSPLGMRHSLATPAGPLGGRENAEPRAKGSWGGGSARHGASPDVASPSSPFGRITSPLEESAALLRTMRRGQSMTQPGQ